MLRSRCRRLHPPRPAAGVRAQHTAAPGAAPAPRAASCSTPAPRCAAARWNRCSPARRRRRAADRPAAASLVARALRRFRARSSTCGSCASPASRRTCTWTGRRCPTGACRHRSRAALPGRGAAAEVGRWDERRPVAVVMGVPQQQTTPRVRWPAPGARATRRRRSQRGGAHMASGRALTDAPALGRADRGRAAPARTPRTRGAGVLGRAAAATMREAACRCASCP